MPTPTLSISTCVHPCSQIEQVARCPAIILWGLSDQTVTIRCLSVHKHTHTHARTHARAHTTSIAVQFCLVSGAESRRMFPRHGPRSRGVWVDCGDCVSSPPSAGMVGVCTHHTHSYSLVVTPTGLDHARHASVYRVQLGLYWKCIICYFHAAMAVESLSEVMDVAPWRSCPLKTQPGSQER